MKSGKQRRIELDAKKKVRAEKVAADLAADARARNERRASKQVAVNRDALAPHGSYSQPEFVARGYYLDKL